MKLLFIFLFIALIFSGCSSTARYRAIKNTRYKSNHSNNHNISRDPSYNTTQLQNYIQDWIGVPYEYGGTTKSGVDCSGFTFNVYKYVYDYDLPRTALDQYKSGRKISTVNLNEGDLVFFRGVRGAGIDHVGVYLEDGKFAHASTNEGVIISNLNDDYYNIRYVGACRY
jgi:cell wall-associated NlpC family hydrolase